MPYREFYLYDILARMSEWNQSPDKSPLYAATVVGIEGSAVRGAGATMGIAADGSLTGSVSGGCIESTVISEVERLRPNRKSELLTFCPTDDPFLGAPSPCGGTVRVCIYPYSQRVAGALQKRLHSGQSGRWAVLIEGPEEWLGAHCALDVDGELVRSFDGEGASDDLYELFNRLFSQSLESNEVTLDEISFFQMEENAPPHAVVVGGSHIGEALVKVLHSLHWQVTVVDPREQFAPKSRFVLADLLLNLWPEEAFHALGEEGNTDGTARGSMGRSLAVAAITHNEAIDDSAVKIALESNAFYIGVLGSRRTFAGRLQRLKDEGYEDADLKRIRGPIGLDISAVSPEEIAVAIAAEMIQDYRKGSMRGQQ